MLRRKLLWMCISLVLFITIVNGFVASGVTVRTINEEVRASFEIEVDRQLEMLTGILDQYRSDILEICSDQKVQQMLLSMETGGPLTQEDHESLADEVENMVHRMGYVNIDFISFSDLGPMCWNSQSGELEYSMELMQEKWYNDSIEHPNVVTYTSITHGGTSVMRAVKCVYDIRNWSQIIGMIALDMEIFPFISALNQHNSTFYLLDKNNDLVYPFVDYYDFISEINLSQDTIEVKGTQYLVSRRSIPMSGWTLAGFITSGELYAKGQEVMHVFWISATIALMMAVLIAFYVSNSIAKAVVRITTKMELANDGELEPVQYPAHYKGEIKVLYDSYNQMVEQINNLIHEVYQAKIKEKDAELQALQAQINPHFIYNTLDTINWMAMRYRAKDIQQMILSLATMLRCSLNNGENLIKLSKEYEQIVNYINIQKVRDPESFNVVYEMDEEIMHYQVIKLILQPLVENAILHGCDGVDYQITIRIIGYLEEGHIMLKVCNNGNRPDLEAIQKLLDLESEEKPKSYGIRNVNMRLVKHYGDQYGIQYNYDEKSMETQAIIRIPVVDEVHLKKAEHLLEDLKKELEQSDDTDGAIRMYGNKE